METIQVTSRSREEVIDITPQLQAVLDQNQWSSGILAVYSPHTTAGITVNENADPDVRRDLKDFLHHLVPHDHPFRHGEGNSDAHIKGTLVNFSQVFIVDNGRLQLGTWQGIFFLEFDGPRSRQVWLKFIKS